MTGIDDYIFNDFSHAPEITSFLKCIPLGVYVIYIRKSRES